MSDSAVDAGRREGGPRRLGVEEEFHLVDLQTRRLAPRAPELLDRIGHEAFVAEMQRCVVEVNSNVVGTLDELRADLAGSRGHLGATAKELGLGIVAAGTVPLAIPAELKLTETARYRRMLADYQLLAREQLICGTQIHVDVDSREQGVRLGQRVAPYLPTLLALSASSPYGASGADTGYASGRTLAWIRWPTTGLASGALTEAEYDGEVEDLINAGIITDEKMMYFDTRPTSIPSLELRICDSCPSIDTIVLIAGLFRALVDREARFEAERIEPVTFSPTLGRAAVWRAARSGLEGELVDLEHRTHRPAAELVNMLAHSLKEDLIANGDWELVGDLLDAQLIAGSSAARQRRAMRRHGQLTDVVDLLMAETTRTFSPAPATADPSTMLEDYVPEEGASAIDEAITAEGAPNRLYAEVIEAAIRLGSPTMRRREARMEDLQRADGVTFRASGQQSRVFPLDL
ncbi:MAG: YbdK family carboxylate-amine ligase, partial [Propionibacteriaceae bacterium]|nr:YbdK family carboxylate-amine ligase [Propionibacteriaceae bacterium]